MNSRYFGEFDFHRGESESVLKVLMFDWEIFFSVDASLLFSECDCL